MKFTLTKPCVQCLFVRGRFKYLRPGRAKEILDGLKTGSSFSCHKTIDFYKENQSIEDKEQFCAGARLFSDRIGYSSQEERIHYRLNLLAVIPATVEGIFKTRKEMISYYDNKEYFNKPVRETSNN